MGNSKLVARFGIFRTAAAILLSFAIVIAVICLVSSEPGAALESFFLGPLSSVSRIGNVVEMMLPITFTGLAICVMFDTGQFSMSAEGSFYFGAYWAAVIAIQWVLPAGLHPLVAIVLGGLAGVLVSLIPALLKQLWNVDEFVTSLMLNYVVRYFTEFLLKGMIQDPDAAVVASYKFSESAGLTTLFPGTRVSTSLLLALFWLLLVFLLLKKTRYGYFSRTIGRNAAFAQSVGIRTGAIILISQCIGGFIAGTGGAAEMLSMYQRFNWHELPNYGFDGIVVATIAGRDPRLVPLAAFFLAYVETGSDIMGRMNDVPSEVVSVIYAVVVILVVAKGFLEKAEHRCIVRQSKKESEGLQVE